MSSKQIEVAVEPKATDVLASLVIDADCNVSFKAGYSFGVDGLAIAATYKASESNSAGIVAANIMRLARKLPAVTVDGKQVSAFAYVIDRVKAGLGTASAFNNVAGLIPCLEIRDANNLKASPFAIKEAMGYANKMGLLADDNKVKAGYEKDSVVLALKHGVGVNAIRPTIAAAKETANKEAEAKKEALPFPKPTGRKGGVASAASAPAIGGTAPTVVAAPELTVAQVALELGNVIDGWEKLVAGSQKPGETLAALRKALAPKFAILKGLMGGK